MNNLWKIQLKTTPEDENTLSTLNHEIILNYDLADDYIDIKRAKRNILRLSRLLYDLWYPCWNVIWYQIGNCSSISTMMDIKGLTTAKIAKFELKVTVHYGPWKNKKQKQKQKTNKQTNQL